jgi:hypothetical protein
MCIICRGEKRGVTRSNCSYCPKITRIPNIEELIHLDCQDCKRINRRPNPKFAANLNHLCMIQRRSKKCRE